MEQIRAEQRGRVIGAFFGVSSAGTDARAGRRRPADGLGRVRGRLRAGRPVRADRVRHRLDLPQTGRPSCAASPPSISRRSADSARSRRSRPGYLTTFQVVMFAIFCAMLRSTSMQSLLPVYVVSDLGYSASEVGYLFGVIGFVQLLMIVPAGFISDKIGRKAAVVPAATLCASVVVRRRSRCRRAGRAGAASSRCSGLASGLATGSMTSFTYDIVTAGGARLGPGVPAVDRRGRLVQRPDHRRGDRRAQQRRRWRSRSSRRCTWSQRCWWRWSPARR